MKFQEKKGRNLKIRKENLGLYFILVINFWMVIYEVATPAYIREQRTQSGFDLIFPIIIGLPWIVIAFKQKDKWAWVRSVVIIAIGYGARALSVYLLSKSFAQLMMQHGMNYMKFHQMFYPVNWIINVTYLVLISVVAFLIHKEELKTKNEGEHKSKKIVKEKIQREEVEKEEVKLKEIAKPKEDIKTEPQNAEKTVLLDINECNEAEFMTLPGMSLLSAKKAVEERETKGSYRSFDDFVSRNEIKPHFMVQMKPLVTVTEIKENVVSNKEKKARMLDL